MFVPAPMNATSKPSILTDRPVLIPEPYFHSNVSLPPASAELAAFRDTECSYYFVLMLQMTFSVLLSYREIPFIMMQSTQSDVGVFTAIWIGWGLS